MGRPAALTKGFTDAYIKNLKAKEKRYCIREGRGFAIQVLPTGFKTWMYIYTLKGKEQYERLGTYPAVTLAEARAKYQIAYAKVQKGIPLNVPLVEVQSELFKDLAEEYIQWSKNNHCDSWHESLNRALKQDVLPFWGDRKITEITRRESIELLERVSRRSPGMTQNVHKAASGVMQYALDREYIEYNPMLRLAKAVPELKIKKRTRVLSEDEIRHIWNCLSESYRESPTPRALKLILLTAQRPGEVAGLHRREIQGDTWSIPAERAEKGQGVHDVYLTQTALDLIGEQQGMIFDVKRMSLSQFVNISHKYFGLPRWTPHDLRRTARTLMAKAGVIDEHAEAVLAHKKPGITAVYNQWQYQDEKKAALILLEQELLRIITKPKTEE